MSCILRVKRQEKPSTQPYWQEFDVEPEPSDTVASLLAGLAARSPLTDREGREAAPVAFEKGCGEAKCGACAMVVNGRTGLACKTFVRKLDRIITLEPLSKFPVVRDLVVDRSVLFETLRRAKAYLNERAAAGSDSALYQSARCLLCGCCMEICPNYRHGVSSGTGVAVTMYRLLRMEKDASHRKEMRMAYLDGHYAGCGVSLSCHDICPAEIPVDEILAKANFLCITGR